jgi:hypothetical protein
VPCRTIVKPALTGLLRDLGNRFQVSEIDTAPQPEAASYWKDLSVPPIFVLNPEGGPQHVHYGVVNADVLRAELYGWLT